MKMKLFVTGLTLAFLTSCATSTAPRDLPPSDIAIFKAGLKQLLAPREIDGSVQYRDEAEDNWQLWTYAGHARDGFDLSEYDKKRSWQFAEESFRIMDESRRPPCHPLNFVCKLKR